MFGEILQHMKDNNATLTAQNKLMRKQNETQKETTKKLAEAKEAISSVSWRLVVVGIGVLLGAAVAGAAVHYNIKAASRIDDTRTKLNTAQKSLDDNAEIGRKINENSKKQLLQLKELVANLEARNRIVIDDKGRAALNVEITEEQARRLKKPRRRASYSAKVIKVIRSKPKPSKDGSIKKAAPRAIVPLF